VAAAAADRPRYESPLGATLRRIELEASPVEGPGLAVADAEYNWTWFNDHVVIENATITALSSSIGESDLGLFEFSFDERFTFEFESPLGEDEIRESLMRQIAPGSVWLPDLTSSGEVPRWTVSEGDRTSFSHEFGLSVERLQDRWRVRTDFERSVNLPEAPHVPYLANLAEIRQAIVAELDAEATPTMWWARVGFTDDTLRINYEHMFEVQATQADLVAHAQAQGWPLDENFTRESYPAYSTPATGVFQIWPMGAGNDTTTVIVYGWFAEVPLSVG
jgi:hypothetical protein